MENTPHCMFYFSNILERLGTTLSNYVISFSITKFLHDVSSTLVLLWRMNVIQVSQNYSPPSPVHANFFNFYFIKLYFQRFSNFSIKLTWFTFFSLQRCSGLYVHSNRVSVWKDLMNPIFPLLLFFGVAEFGWPTLIQFHPIN